MSSESSNTRRGWNRKSSKAMDNKSCRGTRDGFSSKPLTVKLRFGEDVFINKAIERSDICGDTSKRKVVSGGENSLSIDPVLPPVDQRQQERECSVPLPFSIADCVKLQKRRTKVINYCETSIGEARNPKPRKRTRRNSVPAARVEVQDLVFSIPDLVVPIPAEENYQPIPSTSSKDERTLGFQTSPFEDVDVVNPDSFLDKLSEKPSEEERAGNCPSLTPEDIIRLDSDFIDNLVKSIEMPISKIDNDSIEKILAAPTEQVQIRDIKRNATECPDAGNASNVLSERLQIEKIKRNLPAYQDTGIASNVLPEPMQIRNINRNPPEYTGYAVNLKPNYAEIGEISKTNCSNAVGVDLSGKLFSNGATRAKGVADAVRIKNPLAVETTQSKAQCIILDKCSAPDSLVELNVNNTEESNNSSSDQENSNKKALLFSFSNLTAKPLNEKNVNGTCSQNFTIKGPVLTKLKVAESNSKPIFHPITPAVVPTSFKMQEKFVFPKPRKGHSVASLPDGPGPILHRIAPPSASQVPLNVRPLQKLPSLDPKYPRKSDAKLERRIVHVGNLPEDYDRNSLYKRFKRFGSIEKIEVKHPKHDPKSSILQSPGRKRFAFITFKTRDEATKAIENGNKYDRPNLDLNYGARRQFVKEDYCDLDSVLEKNEEQRSTFSRPLCLPHKDDYSRLLAMEQRKRGIPA